MGDFGKLFVSSIVAGGKDAYKLVVMRKVQPEYLVGDGQAAFKYMIDHVASYGEIPSRYVIQSKTGIDIGDPDGKAEFYVAEALNKRLHSLMQVGLGKVASLMGQDQTGAAYKEMLEVVQRIKESQLTHLPAQSMFSHVPSLLELYEKMKQGYKGIPYPFKTMNDATLGMWPQDLILFAARLGVGKSFQLLLMAKVAWDNGYRVLVCTTEMSQLRMAQRFSAMTLKLQYPLYRRGTLTESSEQYMKESLIKLMNEDDGRLKVLGGDFRFSVDSLHAEIDQALPDLVIIDGAYLMESAGDNRSEQAANTFNTLKSLANSTSIPFAVSSQFNRTVKKNEPDTADVSNLALSDVSGWNADVAYGMIQTDDMVKGNRMIFKPLKIREGKASDVECIWDIDNMIFEELPSSNANSLNWSNPAPAPNQLPVYNPNDPSSLF